MRKWIYFETVLEDGDIRTRERIVDEDYLRKEVYPEWVLKFMLDTDSETSYDRFLEVWAKSYQAVELKED